MSETIAFDHVSAETTLLEHIRSKGDQSETGIAPADLEKEVRFYVHNIAPPEYLASFNASDIANHMIAFVAARTLAKLSSPSQDAENLQLALQLDAPLGSVFIFADTPRMLAEYVPRVERLAAKTAVVPPQSKDANLSDGEVVPHVSSVRMYRSSCSAIEGGAVHVYFCFVSWAPAGASNVANGKQLMSRRGAFPPAPVELKSVCGRGFMTSKPPAALARYANIVSLHQAAFAPAVRFYPSTAEPVTPTAGCPADFEASSAGALAPVAEVDGSSSPRLLRPVELSGSVLMIAYEDDETQTYFEPLVHMLQSLNVAVRRAFVERFTHGAVVFTFYVDIAAHTQYPTTIARGAAALAEFAEQQHKERLALMGGRGGVKTTSFQLSDRRPTVPRDVVSTIHREATLLRLVPFRRLALERTSSSGLMMYVAAASVFAFYFAAQRSSDLDDLMSKLGGAGGADTMAVARLRRLQEKMVRESISDDAITLCVRRNAAHVRSCYEDFKHRMSVAPAGEFLRADLKSDGFERKLFSPTAELLSRFKDSAVDESEWLILRAFLIFNSHVLRTNFYRLGKAALAFSLDTRWLSSLVPAAKVPYAMYFVIASHFRGFHLRFQDVSRGGIRFIRQPNQMAHENAKRTLFEENLNLAHTQQLKNKDIPEGGAKGTILSRWDSKSPPRMVFMRYVDALLDLMLPSAKDVAAGSFESVVGPTRHAASSAAVPSWSGTTTSTSSGVIDLVPEKEELLFLGPDEGTAGFMTDAALHAKARGYRYWKGFTTGKDAEIGGVPHDTYGMTTAGVHVYVLKVLEELGLREEEVTKVQIGGPDGDLGSNEILVSKDKTIAVVDGSGVAYDPQGLDRTELTRLARLRIPISNFDTTKIGTEGYLVLVEEKDKTLPNGFVVRNGFQFRNMFHLNPSVTADIFVPCGGRPRSVDVDSVHRLISDDKRKHKFRAIVEGANLFISEDARLILEAAGVLVIKDASANKGGVTSSSLEVLAALALDDDEFGKDMCRVATQEPPAFYSSYVEDILKIIRQNAADEYHAMAAEYIRGDGKSPRPVISDNLSRKINNMNMEVAAHADSLLERHPEALRRVLQRYLPPSLVAKLGMERILERVPASYLRAIFAKHLASRYVYRFGSQGSEFAFYDFMSGILEKDSA
eukprot:TRINITY_DN757_c0_g1_i1.p1 TRINITY_DN757_c0_g1~~TRINITY_DN757_c0_g1_i1.p1  ORF type:complete len:1207 (+),score=392.20 TRINITY_DN757_c0_g1_i1:164-3622(+)